MRKALTSKTAIVTGSDRGRPVEVYEQRPGLPEGSFAHLIGQKQGRLCLPALPF
jgi:hypothetical protein